MFKIIINFFFLNVLKFLDFFFNLFGFKKNYIIFSSGTDNSYNDNSRYLYEYLSKKKLDVFWKTNNEKIKKYLNSNNLMYLDYKNIFRFIYIVLQTKIVISSGSSYYNCFDFFQNKNIIKISLGHGAGNKVVIQKYIEDGKLENYRKFDYVNFTSKFTIKEIGIKLYKLNKNKILNFGYPRIENLIKNITNKNEILPSKILGNYDYEKIMLYTPTWRPYEYNLPLFDLKNFNLKKFNNFLKNKNIILLISLHPMSPKNKYKLENMKYSNIKIINKKLHPIFDTTHFFKFTDILLNDCSTTSTDFSILNKPQIFIFPDYKKYMKHTSLLENYHANLQGSFVSNFSNLKKEISKNIKDNKLYKKKFSKALKSNIKKYYDHNITAKVNDRFYHFLKKL